MATTPIVNQKQPFKSTEIKEVSSSLATKALEDVTDGVVKEVADTADAKETGPIGPQGGPIGHQGPRGSTSAEEFESIRQTPEVSSIKSGSVVSNSTDPVGKESTKEEVVAVAEQKRLNSGGLSLSKEVQSLLDRLTATGNQVAINAVNSIKEYMVNMGPGKTMTIDEGNRHQVALFRAIRSAIEYTGEDFQLTMVTILRLFDEFKDDVFHERYVFRFMESITLAHDERRAFERIINLLKVAAPVAGRKEALRQVNFQRTLQYAFTDEGKQKVMSFFNV